MDLISISSLILRQLDPKESKLARPLLWLGILLAMGFVLGQCYNAYGGAPKAIAGLDKRITVLEFSNATQSVQLQAINASLARIEASVETTRTDVSMLKNTLIAK